MAKPAVQTFGKYQILERIATGGMAEIYKARLEGIGGFQRTFAIKRILPHLSQNAEYVAMLVDEAKVAGLLSHANIVQILDLGQVEGVWYIAMEFVDGRDLGAVLRKAREKGLCLPVPHTVFVAIELLKGLEYAHQRQVMRGGRAVPLNIIHRDIGPPNILLSFQGEVKLTDFGIARASHKALETQSGIIKGRFDYMSPEQAAGAKDLDQRSDLFSVGVVLYEMLTGEHPFRDNTELGTLDRIRSGRYVPASQKNQDVPFTLETIVDRALRVDRNERYPSATAFKEALDKFFHDSGFIFTHSTLAAYVRGLFPDTRLAGKSMPSIPPPPTLLGDKPAAPPAPSYGSPPKPALGAAQGAAYGAAPPAKPKADPQARPPLASFRDLSDAHSDDIDLDLDGDVPTKVMDALQVPDEDRPTSGQPGAPDRSDRDRDTEIDDDLRPAIAPMLRHSPPPGRVSDDETLIRDKLSLDLPPQWADEQETQIRPALTLTPEPAGARDTVRDIPINRRLDRGDARLGAEPASVPSIVEEPPRRGTSGVLLFVVAMTTLGIGLLLGAAGVAIVMQIVGAVGNAPAIATTVALDPRIVVHAGPTDTVTVDGKPAGGVQTVRANTPILVRVEGPGHAPLEETITLKQGEMRVVVFEFPKVPATPESP